MTTQASNRPSHRLYTIKGEDDQARWTEIGATFRHKDGQGFTLTLDAMPLNGRIVMREIFYKEEGDE